MILEENVAIKWFNGSMCSQSPTSNSPNISPLRNESENENKINQNSSVNIRVISYISSIWIITICLKDLDF